MSGLLPSKYPAVGDPGVLDAIVGGAVGFVTGGPAGAIAGAAAGLGIGGATGGGGPAGGTPGIRAGRTTWQRNGAMGRFVRTTAALPTRRVGPPAGMTTIPMQRRGFAAPPNGNIRIGPVEINPPFGGEPGMGWEIGARTEAGEVYVQAETGEIKELVTQERPVTRYGSPPGPGYHLNKSGYWLKNGTYIPKGTVWVKNRRRNPLNPRALDRAMGRIGSAKRAAQKLGRITIRKKCNA